jgi:hypothetical protein
MKKIPIIFRTNEYQYNLLKREKDIVLYEQCKKSETSAKVEVFGYEVHKVRRIVDVLRTKKRFQEIIARDDFKDKEGNEICEFGQYGWSYQQLSNAKKRYEELLKE